MSRRRRSHVRLSIAIASAVVVAACSGGGSDGGSAADDGNRVATVGTAAQTVDEASPVVSAAVATTTPTTTTTTTTTTTEPGNPDPDPDGPPGSISSLTWGIPTPEDFSGLDPAEALDFGTYGILSQVTEHLTAIGGDGVPVAFLAESWESNADATEWTFTLRSDVLFHDGSALTADDVVVSLNHTTEINDIGLDDAFGIDAFAVVDDLTVSVTLDAPTIDLPYRLSDQVPQTAILPDDFFPGGDTLIGTGPFVLVDYAPGEFADFVAFDDWWAGPATIDNLELRFFDFTGDSARALQSGEIDGVSVLSDLDLDSLLDDPSVQVQFATSRAHRQIWMNTVEGPFADVRVRQAFALSIDRDALAAILDGGVARPGNDAPIDEYVPGFDASIPQRTHDPEAARALLADAGFADGLAVTLYVGDLAEIPVLADAIAIQAADAGFDITVDVQPNSTFYSDAWCTFESVAPPVCQGNQSFGIVDYNHRYSPSVYLGRALRSDGEWNASLLNDPVYDELETAYRTAPTDEAAAAAITQIHSYLNTNVPVVIPYFIDHIWAQRAGLSETFMTPLAQPFLGYAEDAG